VTTGSNASGASALMEEGARQIRQGQFNEAYQTFREVVARDPNNEYAWIWISQTSPNLAERRQAVERALQINPNSAHARQALERLRQEETARPAVAEHYTVPPPAAPATDPGDLRSSMGGENKARNKVKKGRDKVEVRLGQPNPAIIAQPVRKRSRFRVVVLLLLLIAIIGTLLLYYFSQQKQSEVATVIEATPTANTTELAATSGVATTAALSPTTAAPNPSPVVTSAAANPTSSTLLLPTATLVGGTTSSPLVTITAAVATSSNPTTSPIPTTPRPAATTVAGSGANGLNQSQQLIATGDYKGAIGILNNLLKTNSKDVAANFRLGSAYLAAPTDQLGGADRYAEAIKSFKRVTDLAPTWAGGYARLGESYAAKGDTASAITALTKSLELEPNGPERWLTLANLYEKNNQVAEAAYARSRAQPGSTPIVVVTTAAVTTTTAAATPPPATPTVRR